MNLIIVHSEELDSAQRVTLKCHRAQHIRKVLKPTIGQALRIGLLDGPLGDGYVEQCDPHGVVLRCQFEEKAPPKPFIDVLLAMPRPKVLKRLWAQFAAMGVGQIILTNAEKVERSYFDSHVLDPDYYVPLLIEGLQQAKDTHLPRVTIRRQLKPLVEDELRAACEGTIKLLADPAGEQRIHEVLGETVGNRIMLAIGPEGGWTPYELELLKENGFQSVNAGSRILRTDTACIALLGILKESKWLHGFTN
jgi:RsmE family RNA methyltransferase